MLNVTTPKAYLFKCWDSFHEKWIGNQVDAVSVQFKLNQKVQARLRLRPFNCRSKIIWGQNVSEGQYIIDLEIMKVSSRILQAPDKYSNWPGGHP